jgi:hypothetical protein
MKCEFKIFDYGSNREFGDKVCRLAERNNAKVFRPFMNPVSVYL